MIIVRRDRGRQEEDGTVIHFPMASCTFRHAHIGRRPVFAAHVPDDHPEIDALRERILQHRRYDVHHGPEDQVTWEAATKAPTPPDGSLALHPVGQDALRRGWSSHDLEGTGQNGDPTDHGGRSPRTGLTMAEMALSTPPTGWVEHAHTHYPWELPGWHTDILGWQLPNPPSKRATNVDEAEPEPAPGPSVEEGDASELVALGDVAPELAHGKPPTSPSPELPPPPPNPSADAPNPGLTDEELEAYAEHLTLLAEMWDKLGEAPSIFQFGYQQRTRGLAKLAGDTFHRLVQAVQADRTE